MSLSLSLSFSFAFSFLFSSPLLSSFAAILSCVTLYRVYAHTADYPSVPPRIIRERRSNLRHRASLPADRNYSPRELQRLFFSSVSGRCLPVSSCASPSRSFPRSLARSLSRRGISSDRTVSLSRTNLRRSRLILGSTVFRIVTSLHRCGRASL